MRKNKQTLSASNIRYLIALHELDCQDGIRCVDIADHLGLSKPSIHTMINTLQNMGLLTKKKYGNVFLTASGRITCKRYTECFHLLSQELSSKLKLSHPQCQNIACAVLSQTEEDHISSLSEQLQDTDFSNSDTSFQ